MKKITGILALAMIFWNGVQACDVCGCAPGGGYLGVLPQFDKHFAGMHFRYQPFRTTHPEGVPGEAPSVSEEYFRSFTVWGRFYPVKRVQVFAFLPYHFNQISEPSGNTFIQGPGDAQLLANYMIVNTASDDSARWRHTLMGGGGIKMPTGKSGFKNREGVILSNMQPGTASWDFAVNLNYTIRYRNWGGNVDWMMRIPTVNTRDYRYGTRMFSGYNLFYWHQSGKMSWLPQAGIRYEWSQRDLSSYTYRLENPYSGGYMMYSVLGMGAYAGSMGLTLLAQIPVSGHYAGGWVQSRTGMEMQLQYLF